MGATLATVDAILKDLYLGPIAEQLNNEVLMLSRLEPRSQEITGRKAIVPLHVGRSGGIGARGEDEDLPAAGNQRYDDAIYNLKYLYGRVRVTGPSIELTSSDAGAFLETLKGELDGIRTDLKRDLARQVYGDGSAAVASLATNTAQTTVTISSAEPLLKGYLYVGQNVDIGDTSNPQSVAANRQITAVNTATPSVTISGAAVTTTTSHRFFLQGSAGPSTTYGSREIDGLTKIIPDAPGASGDVVGQINANAAGKEYWRSLVKTSAGANPTLDEMQQSYGLVRRAGGETSLVVTSFGVQRLYFNLLQSQVRYVEPMKLQSGFQTLEHMGKPIIADIDAPFGKMYFIDERFLKVYSNRDWHFLDRDGTTLKWVVNRDAWEAVLCRYLNLGTNRRNTQLVYKGMTDATGV